MTAIVKKIQINFGALLLKWIGKWVLDADKKKAARKMFYDRFISIILKKKLQKEIRDNEGEALNVNKRIT